MRMVNFNSYCTKLEIDILPVDFQGAFAPVFLPFFLFTMGVMRQDPVHEIIEKIKKVCVILDKITH